MSKLGDMKSLNAWLKNNLTSVIFLLCDALLENFQISIDWILDGALNLNTWCDLNDLDLREHFILPSSFILNACYLPSLNCVIYKHDRVYTKYVLLNYYYPIEAHPMYFRPWFHRWRQVHSRVWNCESKSRFLHLLNIVRQSFWSTWSIIAGSDLPFVSNLQCSLFCILVSAVQFFVHFFKQTTQKFGRKKLEDTIR